MPGAMNGYPEMNLLFHGESFYLNGVPDRLLGEIALKSSPFMIIYCPVLKQKNPPRFPGGFSKIDSFVFTVGFGLLWFL